MRKAGHMLACARPFLCLCFPSMAHHGLLSPGIYPRSMIKLPRVMRVAPEMTRRLVQEDEGQQDGEDDAELVDRCYTRDVARAEGFEIEEPREAGGEAGEDEEEPRMSADHAQALDMAAEEGDAPDK